MVEVYFYVTMDKLSDAVECGLKLSEWYDREITIQGSAKKCISAYLNPKDDLEKYRSETLKCIKLEVDSANCFVADRHLFYVGQNRPDVLRLYEKSIVPIDKYLFGSYRLPECLVTSTILGDNISLLDKRLDSPILFDNSEDLYINNIIETYKENHSDFNDTALYYFYNKLAEIQKLDKIEDNDIGIAVFIDRKNEKTITVKIPGITCTLPQEFML